MFTFIKTLFLEPIDWADIVETAYDWIDKFQIFFEGFISELIE